MELSELEAKLVSLREMRDKIHEDIAMILRDMKKVSAKSSSNEGKKQVAFPIVKDFNFIIGKVDADEVFDELSQAFAVFGDDDWLFAADIFECFVVAGIFESKSQARKNWKGAELQFGFQEIGPIGKSKTHLFIWNLEKK